jgi:transposase
MRQQRTHYDKTFKDNAVKLSLERKNVSGLALELGISPTLLYRRRKKYQERGENSFPGNGVRSREGEEAGRVVELERRLKEAETERDILKKALSIISTSDR